MSIKNSYTSREHKSNLLFHLMTFHRNGCIHIFTENTFCIGFKQNNGTTTFAYQFVVVVSIICTSSSGDESNQFAKFVDLFQLRVNIIHSNAVCVRDSGCGLEWKIGGETLKLCMVDFDMRQCHVYSTKCGFQRHLCALYLLLVRRNFTPLFLTD